MTISFVYRITITNLLRIGKKTKESRIKEIYTSLFILIFLFSSPSIAGKARAKNRQHQVCDVKGGISDCSTEVL